MLAARSCPAHRMRRGVPLISGQSLFSYKTADVLTLPLRSLLGRELIVQPASSHAVWGYDWGYFGIFTPRKWRYCVIIELFCGSRYLNILKIHSLLVRPIGSRSRLSFVVKRATD